MKALEPLCWRAWRPTSDCVTATTNCGRPARRSLAHCSTPRPSSPGAPAGRDSRRRTRSPAAGPIRPHGLWQLAAGIAIGLLAAGAAAWIAASSGLLASGTTGVQPSSNTRTSTPMRPSVRYTRTPRCRRSNSAPLGGKVGANLTPENIALPGLRFTVAFMLAYEGTPLGVIAYVDPSGAPVLLCIFADHATDAPLRSERRDDLSLAWWSNADAAIWSSAAYPRSGPSSWRRRSKSRSEYPASVHRAPTFDVGKQ